jgi:hypothetical protein
MSSSGDTIAAAGKGTAADASSVATGSPSVMADGSSGTDIDSLSQARSQSHAEEVSSSSASSVGQTSMDTTGGDAGASSQQPETEHWRVRQSSERPLFKLSVQLINTVGIWKYMSRSAKISCANADSLRDYSRRC